MNLPQPVREILDTLEQNGYEAYVVGGCVRDILCSRTPCDWDICTVALPEQILQCFSTDNFLKTGFQHGTVTLFRNQIPYEITTYRTDGVYTDNRHPKKVTFVTNLIEDLRRRDFTINAMAYSPKRGFVDFFCGQADMQAHLIRCVGNPNQRFQEDALRILRALRFAAIYDFQIHPETKKAILNQYALLHKISKERIGIELRKLLLGKSAVRILQAYPTIICEFFPAFLPPQKEVFLPEIFSSRLTVLFHGQYSPEQADDILHQLRFDTSTIREVKLLLVYYDVELIPTPTSVKYWLNRMGKERFLQLLEIRQLPEVTACAQTVLTEKQCFRIQDLAINGEDLIQLGIAQGVTIGEKLEEILSLIIEEKVPNNRPFLLDFIKAKYALF